MPGEGLALRANAACKASAGAWRDRRQDGRSDPGRPAPARPADAGRLHPAAAGRRARAVAGDCVTAVVGPAAVACAAHHGVQPAGGERGELGQRVEDEGQVGVGLAGPQLPRCGPTTAPRPGASQLAARAPRATGLPENAARAVARPARTPLCRTCTSADARPNARMSPRSILKAGNPEPLSQPENSAS